MSPKIEPAECVTKLDQVLGLGDRIDVMTVGLWVMDLHWGTSCEIRSWEVKINIHLRGLGAPRVDHEAREPCYGGRCCQEPLSRRGSGGPPGLPAR